MVKYLILINLLYDFGLFWILLIVLILLILVDGAGQR